MIEVHANTQICKGAVLIMKYFIRIGYAAIIFITAISQALISFGMNPWLLLPVLLFFAFINVFPSLENRAMPLKRHRICGDGCELLILFMISTAASILFLLVVTPIWLPDRWGFWLFNLLAAAAAEAVVFWNGIIRVYLTSSQIGLKWRIIGIACGWMPVIHLVVLGKIIYIAYEEARFESRKEICNQRRAAECQCKTKYPFLMIHGVFFRDFKYFNYWGRIPKELERNGAVIYYGNHQSAASVADSGKELAARILQIVEETGCEKVNIIAHSKGGLDSRYAICHLGMEQYVASLTTVNTPHRGCVFADYLLKQIPPAAKEKIAKGYNQALKKLGDENPDFLAAVSDLTASACKQFNEAVPDRPGVYYQSVGSKLNHASDGQFPLNFSYRLAAHFDGPNDGLAPEASFPWGAAYTLLETKGRRGISHGDVIDLNRENIRDFDVREFYISLVKKLKDMGY